MLWYLTLVGHTQSQVGHIELVIVKVASRSYELASNKVWKNSHLFHFISKQHLEYFELPEYSKIDILHNIKLNKYCLKETKAYLDISIACLILSVKF